MNNSLFQLSRLTNPDFSYQFHLNRFESTELSIFRVSKQNRYTFDVNLYAESQNQTKSND